MAFALAINNLIEAMKKPGCPVCRLFRQGSERALESFLWENVNEVDVRQGILDSYGFCPPHTRVMVAREVFTSSLPLGTNIIYEHLGRVVANELKTLKPGSPMGALSGAAGGLRRALARFGLGKAEAGPLHPRGLCPACQAGNNAANNGLHTLCDELQKEGDVRTGYLASAGLCLTHLRTAVEQHSARYPRSVNLMIDEAVRRLEGQSRHMKEYIRKNNWTYREEKLTEEEDTAWRKTLTFFTGIAGENFTHKTED
jgi:hypothetical protein